MEGKHPLFVGTVILVFLSIFTKSQASSPFEALNSAQLSMCQRDVRPSVQKRWGSIAFSRVSTGDLFIPSSCEMKDETAFKTLTGKAGLLLSQGISGSIPLEAENTESLSHTYFCGKAPLEVPVESCLTLQSKTGNHSHPEMIRGARKFLKLLY